MRRALVFVAALMLVVLLAGVGVSSVVAQEVNESKQGVKWEYTGHSDDVYSVYASDGVVYSGSLDNTLVALDAETGEELWSHSFGGGYVRAVHVSDGVVYVGNGGSVVALDAENGEEIWSHTEHPESVISVYVSNGIVYTTSWYFSGYSSSTNSIVAADAENGEVLWARSGLSAESMRVVRASNEAVYVGSDNGNILALDTGTGENLIEKATEWEYEANCAGENDPVESCSSEGDTYTTTTTSEGTISSATDSYEYRYFNGELVVTRTGTGSGFGEAVDRANTSLRGFSEPVATLSVSNGVVYSGSHATSSIFATDSETGEGIWTNSDRPSVPSSIHASNGVVYSGTDEDAVVALDAGTGGEIWNHTEHSDVVETVHASDGVVYSGGSDNTVIAYDTGIEIKNNVSGTVYDCPADDPTCDSSGFGNGVGPNATVELHAAPPSTAGIISSTQTDADGSFEMNVTSEDLNSGTDYHFAVKINGEYRVTATDFYNKSELSDSVEFGAPMKPPVLDSETAYPDSDDNLTTSNATLEINAEDPDFPADELTVLFYEYGDGVPENDTLIGTDTLSSNGTASTSWDLSGSGAYSWYAVAEDKYNYTGVDSVGAFSFLAEGLPDVIDSSASPHDTAISDTDSTVVSVDVEHPNANETITVEFYEYGSGDPTEDSLIGSSTLNGSGRASTTWSLPSGTFYEWYAVAQDSDGDTDTGGVFYFETESVAPRILDDTASPSGDERIQGDSISLEVEVEHDNFPDETVTVEFLDASSGDTIGTDTLGSAGTASTTWNVDGGTHTWYARAEDSGGDEDVSDTFTFSTTGEIRFRDGDTGGIINDQVINLEIVGASGVQSKQITDGRLNLSDVEFEGESVSVSVEANGYLDTTLSIPNPMVDDTVYLQPEGGGGKPDPEGNFSVNITDTNGPVQATEQAEVTVNVTNRLDAEQSGTVVLYADSVEVDSVDLLLGSNESETTTLGWQTDEDDVGTVEVKVRSGGDSDNDTINVTGPPTASGDFEVQINSTNSPIQEGDILSVETSVTNTENTSQNGTITLSIDGSTKAAENVSLDAGATEAVHINWETTYGDAGDYVATVESGCEADGCSDETNVEVTSAGDGGGGPGDGAHSVTFVLRDRTGNFPVDETTLKVLKPASDGDGYNQVHSDRFGSINRVSANLEDGQRYQLRVVHGQNTRSLGGFTAVRSEIIELEIGTISWDLGSSDPYIWDASFTTVDSGQLSGARVAVQFKDPENVTEDFHVEVRDKTANSTVYAENVSELGEYKTTIPANESHRYEVEWTATRDGSEISGTKTVGGMDISLESPFSQRWTVLLSSVGIVTLAGLFGGVMSAIGSVIVAAFAVVLSLTGWFPVPIPVLALAVVVSVLFYIGERT